MIDDSVMRSALADIAKAADRLDVTTSEPKTVTDATETLSLGYRLKPKIGAIERVNGALELSIGPVEDGMVLRAGKPAWWALTGNGRLLAAAPVTSERSLRIGVAWPCRNRAGACCSFWQQCRHSFRVQTCTLARR